MNAATAGYQRDLGDGLVLRWSTADDTERIANLVATVFRGREDDPPNTRLADEVRLLMRGDHPLMGPGDYGVVEDMTRSPAQIVACTCFFRHEWLYEDIPLSVGRPEIVATDPTYRNRGLIRYLLEMVHARSAAEGHLVQAITGITYFYRQFGYEYALDLGGQRMTFLSLIPKGPEGEPEPFTLREARIEDVPRLQEIYACGRRDSIVWTQLPAAEWRYHIEGWKAGLPIQREAVIHLIVDRGGATCGLAVTYARRGRLGVIVRFLELAPGVSWHAVIPPLLRALREYGERMPAERHDTPALDRITFQLGSSHPAYDALGRALAPAADPPYALYVRVPDLPAFLMHIRPVLERRLEASSAAGFSGELKLDFYLDGMRLTFDRGRLTGIDPWRPPPYGSDPGAQFPPLVFLKLVFGYRGLDELRHIFPDVRANSEADSLLRALFPVRPSFVHPSL